MNTSLTKFCRDHDLPKSSVYRRAQELNIDTSDGLAPDDCDRLLHEFNIITAEPKTAPEPKGDLTFLRGYAPIQAEVIDLTPDRFDVGSAVIEQMSWRD